MTHETDTTTVAGEQLKAIVERIERLAEEKKAIADDIKDVYAEAKGKGFDTKALRQIIKINLRGPIWLLPSQSQLQLSRLSATSASMTYDDYEQRG